MIRGEIEPHVRHAPVAGHAPQQDAGAHRAVSFLHVYRHIVNPLAHIGCMATRRIPRTRPKERCDLAQQAGTQTWPETTNFPAPTTNARGRRVGDRSTGTTDRPAAQRHVPNAPRMRASPRQDPRATRHGCAIVSSAAGQFLRWLLNATVKRTRRPIANPMALRGEGW